MDLTGSTSPINIESMKYAGPGGPSTYTRYCTAFMHLWARDHLRTLPQVAPALPTPHDHDTTAAHARHVHTQLRRPRLNANGAPAPCAFEQGRASLPAHSCGRWVCCYFAVVCMFGFAFLTPLQARRARPEAHCRFCAV